MNFEVIAQYIDPQLVVVVPTLWGIGMAVKKSSIHNRFIPLILMVSSCCICGVYLSTTRIIFDYQSLMSWFFASFTQGCIAWLVAWGSYEKFLHDRYDPQPQPPASEEKPAPRMISML